MEEGCFEISGTLEHDICTVQLGTVPLWTQGDILFQTYFTLFRSKKTLQTLQLDFDLQASHSDRTIISDSNTSNTTKWTFPRRFIMEESPLNSVNMNTCSESELLSLKGIRRIIAKRTLKQRAVRAFTSSEDFIARIRGIGQMSWSRISLRNEVDIVSGAPMNLRCRGNLILPRDVALYRRGEWVVVDPQHQGLYPNTLWGIIQSDGINESGMLTVKTGRVQSQQINWKHCVIEQFRREEFVELRDEALHKARNGTDKGLCCS